MYLDWTWNKRWQINITAVDALAKRLAERTGTSSFTGKLQSGETKFRVLPVAGAARKLGVANGRGHYMLGGNAMLVVTRRAVGERIMNEALIIFSPPEETNPRRTKPSPPTATTPGPSGLPIDGANLSGNPVKLEKWAMPKDDEAVRSALQKYLPQLKQPRQLSDVLETALGPYSPPCHPD